MKQIKTKPIGNLVIVELNEPETKTQTGIYIPDTSLEQPNEGTIVAVGDGVRALQTGELIPMQTKVGDVVIFPTGIGSPLTVNGENYRIMRETDLQAIK